MMRLWIGSVVVAGLHALAWAGPVSPGKWLVDLARDYPLTPQAGAGDLDAELTVLLLESAVRIEPDLAEAYRWQIDLQSALDRGDALRSALAALVRLDPADEPARLRWAGESLTAMQTAQDRRSACEAWLAEPNVPPTLAAHLHQQLAGYFWNRLETQQARASLERAVQLDPTLEAGWQMLREMADPAEDTDLAVAALLARLRQSPQDVEAARELGDLLISLGLAREAELWYAHAIAVLERVRVEVPSPLWLGLAWSKAETGDAAAADSLAGRAVQADPFNLEAHLVRLYLARREKNPQAEQLHLVRAMNLINAVLKAEKQSFPALVAAKAAWFAVHYAQDLSSTEKLLTIAKTGGEPTPLLQLVEGAFERRRDRLDRARELLEPLAETDLWARLELARTLEAMKDREGASAQLRAAATQPATSEQRREIGELGEIWQTEFTATQPAGVESIRNRLNAFPVELLRFPFEPDRFLNFSVALAGADLAVGEPLWATFTLASRAEVPITVGPDGMLAPEVVCVVRMRGDRLRVSSPALHLPLPSRLRLEPGQSWTWRETLDIGTIRAGLIGTPQVSHQVEVQAYLNGVGADEGPEGPTWKPGLGGVMAMNAARRPPWVATPQAVRELVIRSQAGGVEDRIAALELLAMLLAEAQHLQAGRLRYPAQKVDQAGVQRAVLARADDPAWEVRARLAECLRWFVLDREATAIAKRLVKDEHELVRGLALRALADHRLPDASAWLQTAAQQDREPWVRRMAELLDQRLQTASAAASSQPVE